MTPFATLTSSVAYLPRDNVDTDAIIPSREMKTTGRTGLAQGLFKPWRDDPDFVLNRMPQAKILASGANFGCGSSREHAVWALAEWGIRCVIAENFAPIFRNNCIRNGLLPVVLPKSMIADLSGQIVTVDLFAQTVDGFTFDIGAQDKAMLLEGLDATDLTLKKANAIAAWTARDRAARPWVYLDRRIPLHRPADGPPPYRADGEERDPPQASLGEDKK
jgi:3-isopropylmalate/(R)-2-methylmalate dehydratase small subunit